MVNLSINSYYNKKLIIKKGKLKLKRKISSSAKESEEHSNAKDAEKHHSLSMNKKNYSGKRIQLDERNRVIKKEKSLKKTMGYTYVSSSSPETR